MKKGWVVLNVLCIGIVCMMMTSCTGIFQHALFKELVDSPQKRTEKTEEVSMIFL